MIHLLKQGIQALLNNKHPDATFEAMYLAAYQLVVHKFGEKLYLDTRGVITNHLIETVRLLCIRFLFLERFLVISSRFRQGHK